MSTRCNIVICEDTKQKLEDGIILWRHWDGYPGKPDGTEHGVMADLAVLLPDVVKHVGWHQGNIAAQILAWLVRLGQDGVADRTQADKSMNALGFAKGDMFSGFAIDQGFCGDTEYVYRVDPSGVTAYKVDMEWDTGVIKRKKVVGKWTYASMRKQRKASAFDILLSQSKSKKTA